MYKISGIFIFGLLLSAAATFFVKEVAIKFRIVDYPDKKRKFHRKETPLLGGIAIFLSFFAVLFLFKDNILQGNLSSSHWLGFFAGSLVLMLGGFFDDKFKLNPGKQIIFPVFAVVFVLLGGVKIEKLSNPLGGNVQLGLLISHAIIFLWLMGMMYTTKLLDGLDGLVAGVTSIGSIIIFLFTFTTKYYQPDVGFAALVLASAALGFLVFNWHPAKIFLGEGGSLFLGFALGVLAIISGGKIAIALLVMGIPILDVVWTIIRRLREGKNPLKFSDRGHLHFRFLDTGLSERKTVLIYYFFSSIFGLSALFLQSVGKVYALVILIIIMVLIVHRLGNAYKQEY